MINLRHVESELCMSEILNSKLRLDEGRSEYHHIRMSFGQVQISSRDLISNDDVRLLIYITKSHSEYHSNIPNYRWRYLRLGSDDESRVLFSFIFSILQRVAREAPFLTPEWYDVIASSSQWTRALVFLHLLYLTVNIYCSTFEVFTIKELGNRTGTMSLINIISTYFDYCYRPGMRGPAYLGSSYLMWRIGFSASVEAWHFYLYNQSFCV